MNLGYIAILLFFGLFSTSHLRAHCEIPCGIYDDELRMTMMGEHITTIEKAMIEIKNLTGSKKRDDHQVVRWVTNKEKHAEEFQHVVTQYFMTQRLNPEKISEKDYFNQLTLLHQMLLVSVKAKQTLELSHVEQLRGLLKRFGEIYFKEHKQVHKNRDTQK